MKNIVIALLLVTSVYSLKAQETDTIVLLNPTEFKAQVESKEVQLIDVRTPEEFEEGHIKNAVNIDFYSEDFEYQFNKLNKEQPIYLYCRSGYRSNQSALKLEKMGFTEIYDLEGGILNYTTKE